MSSYRTKKKRRRAKIQRWKKRWKKQFQRTELMKMIGELEHASILSNYADVIRTEYTLKDKEGFRWVHDPLEGIDSLPQKFQNPEFKEDDIALPPKDASKEAIEEFINSDYFTLSHFETTEQAESAYWKALKGRLDKVKETKRKRIIEKFKARKGSYIQKVHYRYGDALIGKTNENGHFNILPRRGLTINDVIDLSYKPQEIVVKYEET